MELKEMTSEPLTPPFELRGVAHGGGRRRRNGRSSFGRGR